MLRRSLPLFAALFCAGVVASTLVTAAAFAPRASAQTGGCPLVGALAPPSGAVSIGAVQGVSDASAPFTGSAATASTETITPRGITGTATVHGIVTMVTYDSSRGFYLQDCGDGNPKTSDGLFIFTGGNTSPAPVEQVGDVVTVTGTTGTFFGQTQISQSNVLNRVKKGSGAALPAPVDIDVPNNTINPDAFLYFERLEGMRVRMSSPRVTGAAFRLPGASANTTTFYAVDSDDATELVGGGQLLVKDLGGANIDYNPENIQIADDGVINFTPGTPGVANPIVAPGLYPGMPPVQVGDTCADMIGVINYSFSSYKLFPETDPELLCTVKAKPAVGSSAVRARAVTEITVGSFNVENMFPVNTPLSSDAADVCTAAADAGPCLSATELETKMQKLTIGMVNELRCPDVIGIEETYSEAMLLGDPSGNTPGSTVKALVPRLIAAGCPYSAKSFPTYDARGIEVGVLWRTDRGLSVGAITQLIFTAPVGCPAGDPFNVSSPGRSPLSATFTTASGTAFTVIVNHWKSKGGDDALFGQIQPPLRSTEDQRKCQGLAIRNHLNTLGAAAKVVVLGDFNDFPFAEPGEGTDALALMSSGTPALTNVTAEPGAYSYNFSGNSQLIDHILLSQALLPFKTGVQSAHMNADFGEVWRADPTIAQGASDHDPDVVYLALDAVEVPVASRIPTLFFGAVGLVVLVVLMSRSESARRSVLRRSRLR